MRRSAVLVLGLGLLATSAGMPARAMVGARPATQDAKPLIKVGYYCSPGFVASYGRCIATASTDEVDLYLNDPSGYDVDVVPVPVRHRHHRRGIPERY